MKFKIVLILLLGVLLFTACNEDSEEKTLTIGLMADVGAAPFIVAEEEGYYEEKGLQVTFEVFRSAMERDAALQAGQLDGIMADQLAIAFFTKAKQPYKMVAASHGDYVLVTAPGLSKADFLALDQQEIGLSSNTVIDFATSIIGTSLGDEVTLKAMAIPQMPVRLEMLSAGELDGATLPEPLASAAIARGGQLVSSTGRLDLQPGILIFSSAIIQEKPEVLKDFFTAYNQGADLLNQRGIEDYFDLFAERLGFPVVLSDGYELPQYHELMEPDQRTFELIIEWMLEKNLLEETIEYEQVTDTTSLP